MATILRKAGPEYGVTYDKVPLGEVANSERFFPDPWIADSGDDDYPLLFGCMFNTSCPPILKLGSDARCYDVGSRRGIRENVIA